jgi:hypothetical protein
MAKGRQRTDGEKVERETMVSPGEPEPFVDGTVHLAGQQRPAPRDIHSVTSAGNGANSSLRS